ncbi:MAG: pyridoxal-phosphate dependent enzyme [Desulfohalobiaceae bacterium]|nr:pyridoxal-phosphate dependent enzyme [Desulfohalobiaceae bacterium]
MDFNYICSECERSYPLEPGYMVCPECARTQDPDQPLSGILEVVGPAPEIPEPDSVDFLPLDKAFFPPLPVGNTPLWRPERLQQRYGFSRLYLKDDRANPTSSFKDRASYLVSAFARKHGITDIVLASTGNAASSMAGVAAAAGQQVSIFLPETVPLAKLVQALQYGASVFKVAGNYDLAFDFSLEYSRRKGGLNRNTAYNPMTIEGKKTVSLELYKQMKGSPDVVFVPTGDGCILSGVYKGFRDLLAAGCIDSIPLVYAVQAEHSAAIARAYVTGRFERVPTETLADSISVDVPKSGLHAVTQLRTYQGRVVTVTDEQIIEAQAELSAWSGLFAEPAAAATFAGFCAVRAELDPDARIVLLMTGNGLKDIDGALQGIRVPDTSIRSVDEALGAG